MNRYIRIDGVNKSFQIGSEVLQVLKDITLDIHVQETVSIVGASGAGKSTLLHLLGALDQPSTGNIYYEGVNVFELPDAKLANFRNTHIGFVFQFHHLLPEFTALENVMMPLLIRRTPKAVAQEHAEQALQQVGLQARILHKPGELSGGEQQRVAIARAIVNEPTVILADEPTGNLDTKTGETISELLARLNQDLGIIVILVTHNEQLAHTAKTIIHLTDGEITDIVHTN
ncbi:ATP-binding cassette domain-containing protein [candidate division KSB3 bacterium]|uniref:ATP-binding cassette domain-containing protein n=1 Tax=candidate division KSB3 bacterium TaxID=2044937 RepID=A0A9D5Q821_9BACT|nr:ATP-binding cassette domain-containing protein [candidate division KSB3 bacterium]MBD3327479.1 ATP-binding cassette domain-containing protein [candidate division KSB3 bacterium]